MTVFLTMDRVVKLALAFGIQTKTSFLEYEKQVNFSMWRFLKDGSWCQTKSRKKWSAFSCSKNDVFVRMPKAKASVHNTTTGSTVKKSHVEDALLWIFLPSVLPSDFPPDFPSDLPIFFPTFSFDLLFQFSLLAFFLPTFLPSDLHHHPTSTTTIVTTTTTSVSQAGCLSKIVMLKTPCFW